MKNIFLFFVILTIGNLGITTEETEKIEENLTNKWVLSPNKLSAPYKFCRPIYVSSREQILLWGRDGASGGATSGYRNDVIAYDEVKKTWISDYPSASNKELMDAFKNNIGVKILGHGGMLPSGSPAPSMVSCGGVWDSKRKQLIYCMAGITAAYNPETRKWSDLKANNVPLLYGVGAGYDPINDEIVIFPHFGALNDDLIKINGNVSAHQGTWVYSFKENAWRRTGETFGSVEVKLARKNLQELIGKISLETDKIWAFRISKNVKELDGAVKNWEEILISFNQLLVTSKMSEILSKVTESIIITAKESKEGKWNEVFVAGCKALSILDKIVEENLRVEPPPRCATPLIYDPKNQVFVMFGGHTGLVRNDLKTPEHMGGEPGRTNDTWIYDCKTRQWKNVSKNQRPPATLWPNLVYDPVSGLVLLVTRAGNIWDEKTTKSVFIWGFDVSKSEWFKLDQQEWKGSLADSRGTGWGTIMQEIALDEKTKSLLLLQVCAKDNSTWQETWTYQLDVSKLKKVAVSEWQEPAPIKNQIILDDNPDVVNKLKNLPANKWIHMYPKNEGPSRDWGNAACDPVRGHVYYFGGGHSSYQVNDVAIYSPGANAWVYGAGDHNDWAVPANWGGSNIGIRGGPNACHQRNKYVALDGRMYVDIGSDSWRWGFEKGKIESQRQSWFYDVDRGGVWRRALIESKKSNDSIGYFGGVHLSAPDGRIFGFGGALEPYDGRFSPGETYVSSLDAISNKLLSKKVLGGPKCDPNEDRPFCFIADRNQIFFYEYVGDKDKVSSQGTWVYDIKSNTFTSLKPKRQPPSFPQTVEYINGQDVVFAIIQSGQQWAYSFKENTWAPVLLDSDNPNLSFAKPYAQTVYSAKYGVLVNIGSASKGTALMRPDFSQFKWE